MCTSHTSTAKKSDYYFWIVTIIIVNLIASSIQKIYKKNERNYQGNI